MIVGVAKEIKEFENRVAAVPAGVNALVSDGHEVLVEKQAGIGVGHPDEEYAAEGAKIVERADLFGAADMIMKVKEPLPSEYELITAKHTVFTYFHFAASRELTDAMLKSGATCMAYETIERDGTLPLLTPMSEVAGKMASQEGAKYLEKPQGGLGILLGGVAGVEPATVVVIGGGVVGVSAARVAAGMGARVVILDVDVDRLRYLEDVMPKNCTLLMSDAVSIREWAKRADLLIGAVYLTGKRAPTLVSRELVGKMKKGAVIVDVAIDQGGCIETCRPTTHGDPTYEVDGVIHYCVANMPGAVPKTSTYALTNVTLPYARNLAAKGFEAAVRDDAELRLGANVVNGKVTHAGVAESFELEYVDPLSAIG